MKQITIHDRARRVRQLTNAFRAGCPAPESSPGSPDSFGDPHDPFTEENAAQLARLPHQQQMEILTCPAGTLARELAASTIRALEENGIRV